MIPFSLFPSSFSSSFSSLSLFLSSLSFFCSHLEELLITKISEFVDELGGLDDHVVDQNNGLGGEEGKREREKERKRRGERGKGKGGKKLKYK